MRARIYWLVDEREAGPTCEESQLEPPQRGSATGPLVSRAKLDGGDTLVVRCQRDAEARRQRVTLAFQPHQGC